MPSKTYEFELEDHLVEATVTFDVVKDDYGVPGSPTFYTPVDFEWTDYIIDDKEMTNEEICNKFGPSFKGELDDYFGNVVDNDRELLY